MAQAEVAIRTTCEDAVVVVGEFPSDFLAKFAGKVVMCSQKDG